jgi:hypothetical protein
MNVCTLAGVSECVYYCWDRIENLHDKKCNSYSLNEDEMFCPVFQRIWSMSHSPRVSCASILPLSLHRLLSVKACFLSLPPAESP